MYLGKMFRVASLGLLVLLLAATMLAGNACAPAEEEGVTITIVNMEGWPVTAPLWDKIDEFTAETGIHVRRAEFPFSELKAKQLLELSGATGSYDVVLGSETMCPAFFSYLMPLNDLIAEDYGSVEAWKADQIDSNLPFIMSDGDILVSPLITSCGWLIYRAELFEDPEEKTAFKAEYGYELKPPETEAELIDIAQFFTRDTDGDGHIDLWGYLVPGKWDHGGCVFENQLAGAGIIPPYYDDNFDIQFAKPQYRDTAIAIAQFDQDLIHKYEVMPLSVVDYQMAELSELWLKGMGAMSMTFWGEYWIEFNKPVNVAKIGETKCILPPTPIMRSPQGAMFPGGPWSWGIPKDSEHPEAAWKFIDWTVREDIHLYKLSKSVHVPPKWSIAEAGVEAGYIPEGYAEACAKLVVQEPIIGEFPGLRDVIRENHEKLLAGDITAEEFVDQSAAEMEALLEEWGYR